MTHRYTLAISFVVILFASSALRAQCPITVNAGEDLYICAPPSPTQLNGSIDGDFLNFFWSPTTGMTSANTLTPTVTVSTSTNYVLTVRAADFSNNLISNGDFESGNVDFTSDYIYSPGDLWPEGVYDVITNPQSSHSNFAPCADHTSGAGNMMVVNGAGTPNQNVWCQTVTVNPNTQYVFSAWLTSVVSASPALLQFSINGTPIGSIFGPTSQVCNWSNFFTLWNSGGNGSATICIVNMNTALSGNDFAIDDILFAPTCLVTDTVRVNVINITAAASPAVAFIPCDGAEITLSGAGSSTGAGITYSWDTPNGNIVSGQNTLNPVVNATGTYTLTVTYDNGFTVCEKTATVTVAESPNQLAAWITPPPPIGCGSNTVLLIGNTNQPAFAAYEWTTSNGNIVSGQNAKNATVDQPGTYTLLVTNTNTGCTATTEITVTSATNPPTANATAPDTITCTQLAADLSGIGSTTGANISYAWTTSNGTITSGQSSQNAVAGAGGTYILAVTNTSNNCTSYDTVTVAANIAPPSLGVQPPGILDCDTDTLTLSATVTPTAANVIWTTSGGGNIASGQNTLNPQITAAGTYTITATNPDNGCSSGASATINADYAAPTATAQPADTLTCQQSSVTLSGTGSSMGANFNYNWTASSGGNIVSGQNTLTPVVNAAGTYTLLVANTTNGCTATTSVPVAADTNIVIAIANAPDTLTCAIDTVTLNTNGSSSGASLTYFWTTATGNITGGANTPNPTVNTPGTYQLLLTNTANGCSATDVAIVGQNTAPPNVQIALPDTLTCASPSQTIDAQNLSLPGNFNYAWTAASGGNIISGDSTLGPVVNAAGIYTLTTTNLANGCTSVANVTVAIEAGTPVAVVASPGPLTCTQPTQVLSSSGSSTGANFTYQWATANGNISLGANTPAPTVNQPGDYNLLITNTSNGCTATDTVSVSENKNIPPALADADGLLTCDFPLSNLIANNGASNGTLLFNWTTTNGNLIGDPTSDSLSCDQPGLYHLLVTDPANGCTATDSVSVAANQQAPPVTILSPGNLTCVQLSVPLNTSGGTPNFQYHWQTTDGQFVSGQTSDAPVVDAPGSYFLTVTDPANGCTTELSVTVSQNIIEPGVLISPPQTLTCEVTQIILDGDGGGIPQWTDANGNIVAPAGIFVTQVDAPGVYTLTTIDPNNGCTSVASVTVQQDIVSPLANAGADDTLSCSVNSLTINGSGSATGSVAFDWSVAAGGNIVTGQNTPTPVVDAPGTYTLLVTNTNNGCTATDAVEIFNDLNAPQANAGPPATLTCAIQQTTLNATASTGPNFTYSWVAANGGNILSGQNTLNPAVNEPGTYILTVNNLSNGCVATSQVVVDENIVSPPVGADPPGTLTCAVTSLNLSGLPASGNYSWIWQTSNGNIVSGADTPNPVIDESGSYTLVVIDQQNGCSATAFSIVSEDVNAPVISAAAPQILTCAVLTVPVNGSVTQPTSGFAADWATTDGNFVSGQNTLNPVVDEPGVYILTVENLQNGCTTTAQTFVLQNITPPVAQAAAPDEITCADPVVSLNGTGSSTGTDFTYDWSGGQITGGQNTLAPTVSAAGTYSLTVTDQTNGCTTTATATVGSNTTPPTVVIAAPATLTCIQNSATLNGSGSSSGVNFSPIWTTSNGQFVSGQNTLNPVVNQSGTYILTIQNLQNGCAETAQTVVLQNIVPPGADAGLSPELHCNQPEATLQGSSPTAGSMAYSWSTTNGNIVSDPTTQTPLVDAAGSYALTVTDPANGCTSTAAVLVTEVPPPAFTPELMQPDCHDSKGAVDLGAVTGGSSPFQYSKDGGQTFQSQPFFNSLSPGNYDLVVRDAFGCTAEASVQLDAPFLPTVSLPEIVSMELGEAVSLEPVLNQSAANIATWQWSPADGLTCSDCQNPTASPFRFAIYTLTITDLNGCEAQARVQINVDKRRYLYVPNIFSPDGDGVNDMFTVYARGVKEIRSLQVFDRWGAEIFLVEHLQPNDELRGWDGRFRGKELNPAVFVWQAVVEFVDGEVEVYSGDVTVQR